MASKKHLLLVFPVSIWIFLVSIEATPAPPPWWCPIQCNCRPGKSDMKRLPSTTFWLSSSGSSASLDRRQYGVQAAPWNNTEKMNSSSFSKFSIDCSRRGIGDVKTLFDNVHNRKPGGGGGDDTIPNIDSIILNQNQITEIGYQQFDHWPPELFTFLHQLHMDHNRLFRLSDETFVHFISLRYLNLASNQITVLEPLCFSGLIRLIRLDLSGNHIATFPSDQISPSIMPMLSEINLRQNHIEWVPALAFNSHHVYHQQYRHLERQQTKNRSNQENEDGNEKKKEEEKSQNHSQIINFDLQSNPAEMLIDPEAFVFMPRLKRIYLSELRHPEQLFPVLTGTNSVEHIKLDRWQYLDSIDGDLCRNVGNTLKSLIVKSARISVLPPLKLCPELRLLDFSYNEIKSIPAGCFKHQSVLIDLSLDHNQIELIEPGAFDGLRSLKVLNMEANRLGHLDPMIFSSLTSLRDLNLGHNQFSELPTEGLRNIIEIKVHGNRNLKDFPPPEAFPYVQTLAMSYAYHCCQYIGRMQRIDPGTLDQSSPKDPPGMQDSIVWLEDIDDDNVNLTITELAQQFWKLYNYHPPTAGTPQGVEFGEDPLYNVFARDLYAAAVESPAYQPDVTDGTALEPGSGGAVFYQANEIESTIGQPIKCLPRPDPFMPCKDLFDWWTLRIGVWLVFPLALIGNGTVLVVLVFGRRKRRRSSKLDVPRFLVCNLAAADLFMGIYLGILAVVDAVTLGYFRYYAVRWQNSVLCQFTGMAGVLSAELSVYTLAVITLERNYAITHAMHLNKRLSLKAAAMVMSFGWVFSLLMALLPLFGVSDYRKVAVCLPFQTDNFVSRIYILALIIFNGLAFLLLMACYLRMYCAIRGSQAWNSNDTRIAMRMALLVFTDFLCWAPIAFFTITALAGIHLITLEQAKIFTVFVLPLNACANPFLYAFFTKQFKKECTNLYKRLDGSRFMCGRQRRFSGQRGPSDPGPMTPPIIVSDNCKHCGGHRDPETLSPHGFFKSLPIEHQDMLKVNDDDPQPHDADDEQSDEAGAVKSPPLPKMARSPCTCSNHHLHHQAQQPVVVAESATPMAAQYGVTRLVRRLFSPDPEDHDRSRWPPKRRRKYQQRSKQFKSNSIIYQSNYRKNHVHMTLENEAEMMAGTSESRRRGRFGKISSSSSSGAIASVAANNSNNQSNKQQQNSGGVSIPIEEKNGSKCSPPSLNNQQNSNGDKMKEDSRRTQIGIHRSLESTNSSSDSFGTTGVPRRYHSTGPPLSTQPQQQQAGAMTTGILMLKNKLIRGYTTKNYPGNNRKWSTDSSQLEFSYYSYRKDSTSTTTGRLSFSSDANNATRSTSSSFVSSGFWSTSGRPSADAELILNHDEHQTFVLELGCSLPEIIRQRIMVMINQHPSSSSKCIVLPLATYELHQRCPHSKYGRSQSTTTDDDDDDEAKSNVHQYVLYVLDHVHGELFILMATEDPNESSVPRWKSNHICQDCIENHLVQKLLACLEHKTKPEVFEEKIFESLNVHTIVLRCPVRIIQRALHEINEETTTTTASSQTIGPNGRKSPADSSAIESKSSKSSGPQSKGSEKFMNFLQILLPGVSRTSSSKSSKSPSPSSFYRQPRPVARRKPPKSVVTKPIRIGTRRSSSAFALNEEILNETSGEHGQLTGVRSCSQLPVETNSQHSMNSINTDSDGRSRSAISDRMLTIRIDQPGHVELRRTVSNHVQPSNITTTTSSTNYHSSYEFIT